jgi:hypothetical protein
LSYQHEQQIPLSVYGNIFSADEKKVVSFNNDLFFGNNESIPLSGRRVSKHYNNIKSKSIIPIELSKKIIEHLDEVRENNKKGDVVLTTEFIFKYIQPFIKIIDIKLSDEFPNRDKLPEHLKEYKLLLYHHDLFENFLLLAPNAQEKFMEIRQVKFRKDYIIKSSDWVHEYAPAFTRGNYMILEYYLPDDFLKNEKPLTAAIKKSFDILKEMHTNLIKMEWIQVISLSRKIVEIWRNIDSKKDDELKRLLITDGFTEQAYLDFNNMLQKFFEFSSKFIHATEKNKAELMGNIKAYREDAYFIYSTSVHLIHMISKKMERYSHLSIEKFEE